MRKSNTENKKLRTQVRAGAEVYACVVKVVDGKATDVSCEKLGDVK